MAGAGAGVASFNNFKWASTSKIIVLEIFLSSAIQEIWVFTVVMLPSIFFWLKCQPYWRLTGHLCEGIRQRSPQSCQTPVSNNLHHVSLYLPLLQKNPSNSHTCLLKCCDQHGKYSNKDLQFQLHLDLHVLSDDWWLPIQSSKVAYHDNLLIFPFSTNVYQLVSWHPGNQNFLHEQSIVA